MNMKQFTFIISAILLLFMAVGCNQDDYLHYDTDSASIKFTSSENDSTVYSFRLHPGETEGLIEIPVQLIGLASPQAREISAEIVAEKSNAIENTDFVILHSEIMADSIHGVLKVLVKKTDILDNESRRLTLRLCPNQFFESAPVNQSLYTIVVNNELLYPDGWIFGEYSQVKHEFVILHTGIATDYNSVWTNSEKLWWKSKLIDALYEYNLAHPGDPLKDENGILISF